MNHLDGNVHSGLAGNENDASPICCLHVWQVMPAQANSAHKICPDDGVPVVVGDFLQRLRLVYTKVIDKNIYRRQRLDAFRATPRCCEIGSYTADFCVADFLLNRFDGGFDAILSTTSNNNGCFPGQSASNCKADPCCRAGDQCA